MRIKLTNAKILVNTYTPVFEGEICIENDRIIHVGRAAMKGEFDKVIDCKGNLLMSSFCNAHAHAAMCYSSRCKCEVTSGLQSL